MSLRGAKLNSFDLSGTDLSYADLRDADLSGADLFSVDFFSADFSGADLTGANLTGANIERCVFNQATIKDTIMPDFPLACPEKGSFIGYKKIARTKEYGSDRAFIVKLEIPEDGKRSSSTSNKCRCSKAKVLEIKDIDSGETFNEITNINRKQCFYKVGEMVYPDSFDECRWHECSSGIHFFMTEDEAIKYI